MELLNSAHSSSGAQSVPSSRAVLAGYFLAASKMSGLTPRPHVQLLHLGHIGLQLLDAVWPGRMG